MICLINERFCVQIAERGAEIVSVKNAAGREYIWQADPAFWAKHCPVLFPVCGRLAGFQFTVKGKTYKTGNHGFAQRKMFSATQTDATRAEFVLCEDEETLAEYPYPFRLRILYRLDGDTLNIDTSVENPAAEPLYCNFGSHEAYACDGDFTDWSVRFEKREDLVLAEQVGGYLSGKKIPYAQNVQELALTHAMFENDSLLFDAIRSRKVTLCQRGAAVAEVRFDPFEHLLLWTKPGAPYLCIEPWNGLPDPVRPYGDLCNKPGILRIGGGEKTEMSHSIRFFD